MEMKKYKLGEIADVIGGVNFEPTDIEPNGIRILRGGNIQNHTISIKEDDVFLPAQYQDVTNQVQVGDTIIVASTGSVEVLGKAATCFDEIPKTQIGAFLRLLRPKEPQFAMLISIVVNSKHFRKYIRAQAKGTSINNINLGHLKSYEFEAPAKLESISTFYYNIETKMTLNRAINHNLEAMAKQLYDYWFVQFDFPNEEGKPYKSSGGKMVWNDALKRDIPEGWHCGNLFEIANFTNGLACQKFRPKTGETPLPVIKIREMRDGFTADTEEVTPNIPDSVKVFNGDILFSWSASLEVMLWVFGEGGLNQHIFKVTSANGFPRSFYYYQLLDYIDIFKKMAEARKTTMGHITQDHLQQSTIAIPDDKSIADKFDIYIAPIFEQIVKQQEEIQSLTKQRDELLPLLMNGQAMVNYDLCVRFIILFYLV